MFQSPPTSSGWPCRSISRFTAWPRICHRKPWSPTAGIRDVYGTCGDHVGQHGKTYGKHRKTPKKKPGKMKKQWWFLIESWNMFGFNSRYQRKIMGNSSCAVMNTDCHCHCTNVITLSFGCERSDAKRLGGPSSDYTDKLVLWCYMPIFIAVRWLNTPVSVTRISH